MEDEYTQNNELPNYSMYKICPKNKDLNYCYIGHTTNIIDRMKHHKMQATSEVANKIHFKLYQAIKQNGGWNEWEMIELDKINQKTKLQARIREQELIIEHKANLNTLNAYITEEERATTKKAITEKYREENKELIRAQEKKYKEEHKEIIAEQMKKYREENKEKIREKNKEYKEKNMEKFKEWDSNWREKNKEILKEKRKQKTAELKLEKLKQQELLEQTPEWQEQQKQIAEEKERIKKEKREQYNAERREQRLKAKLEKENALL